MSYSQTSQTAAIPCLTQAIEFLTRPFLVFYSPTKILSLRLLLQTALTPLFLQRRQNKLVITISGGTVAPRALYPTCIAAGIRWADWFTLLGGFEFDLIIEPSSVIISAMGQRKTIWVDAGSNQLNPNAPVFRSTTATRQTLQATLNSAIERSRTRTLAQLILESPHEDLEADELFDCISKVSIAPTPAPTQSTFSTAYIPLSSASEISRPSSRSSNSSSSSSACFSALSDESIATSVTSMSSISPVIAKIEVTPSITYLKRELPVLCVPQQQQQQQPRQARRVVMTGPGAVVAQTQVRPPRFQTRMAAQVRANAIFAAPAPAAAVAPAAKDVTKYLYQGGVSTVLTGGVMLGGGAGASVGGASGAGGASKPQQRRHVNVNGNWRRF
ncbi:hypothetical protein BDN72DRAFT_841089 [Pluteus cervinus]|uniref:Uncharacterized protein n=1 Tax=Pluteus cervinus TaxID=181527 RepID=A0ACD3ATF9_9AGAR|nr:hypothetical protein BDN72DRAFT_841089 [Pluteus cervinus]